MGKEGEGDLAEAVRPRKCFEHKSPGEFFSSGTFRLSFDLRARSLEGLSVGEGGRGRRGACHTAQATVEVAHPSRVQFRGALARHLHQVDAAARRIHFLPPQHVGGANGQTKSAVHALFDHLVRRRMMRVERARAFLFCGQFLHQMPPTNRPGFSVFFGSSCCFTSFIKGSASPASPQASNAGIFTGRWSATSDPLLTCNSPRDASSAPLNESALL